MPLSPAVLPWIRMQHPDIADSEQYVHISAYEAVWYALGWRSDDDPGYTGPGTGGTGGVLVGPQVGTENVTVVDGLAAISSTKVSRILMPEPVADFSIVLPLSTAKPSLEFFIVGDHFAVAAYSISFSGDGFMDALVGQEWLAHPTYRVFHVMLTPTVDGAWSGIVTPIGAKTLAGLHTTEDFATTGHIPYWDNDQRRWVVGAPPSGGGGGAVDSVNGSTGVVVLDASDVGAIDTSAKGAANGVAELDASGLVPAAQLPSYVDDVLEYAHVGLFPGTGEVGKVYISHFDGTMFRWTGTLYVEVSSTLALGDQWWTAHRGDHGADAYTHSLIGTGNPHGVTAAETGAVPSGLLDAKGDLIAASADNTPAKLAVGADYLPLRALASETTGLGYGTATVARGSYVDNSYYLMVKSNGAQSTTTIAPGANTITFWLMEVLEPITIDGLFVFVNTGSAGAKWRLGWYALNPTTGKPTGKPIFQDGEIDASTGSTYKTDAFTASSILAPGAYAGALASSSASTAYRISTGVPMDHGSLVTSTVYGSLTAAWAYSSGGLPDATGLTINQHTSSPPYVRWKVRR